MSRKTASATWLTPKPLRHTSWLRTVTQRPTRCSWNSSRAFSARCWWNSTVCRWPVGAMVRMMAWDTEPLPVPGGTGQMSSRTAGDTQETAPPSPWKDPHRTHGARRSGYSWASLPELPVGSRLPRVWLAELHWGWVGTGAGVYFLSLLWALWGEGWPCPIPAPEALQGLDRVDGAARARPPSALSPRPTQIGPSPWPSPACATRSARVGQPCPRSAWPHSAVTRQPAGHTPLVFHVIVPRFSSSCTGHSSAAFRCPST